MSENKKKRFKHGKQGQDRQRDSQTEEQSVDENSPVIKLFRQCQNQLDSRYDKHERIVKLSRDITIESKRTIFLLHRIDLSPDTDDILMQAEEKLRQVENTKFKDVARELTGEDPYQFLRAYSAGLQEYIEALSFYHYLKENKLISLSDVEDRLTFQEQANLQKQASTDRAEMETTEGDQTDLSKDSEMDIHTATTIAVTIPPIEFILGVADLTGELMRKAINSVGSGDLSQPFKICSFMQELGNACVAIGYSSRELNRKIYTLQQSLRKVENACYTLQVRGSEIPKHMLIDALSKATVTPYPEESIIEDED